MASKFGGIPLDEVPAVSGSRFGGVPLDEAVPVAEPAKQNLIEQIGASSLGQAVGGAIDETGNIIKNIPNQNPASSALQIAGQGAKMIGAPVGQIIGAAAAPLQAPAEAVAGAIDSTSAGQYIGDKLMQARDLYSQFTQANPEISKNIGAAANIVGTLQGGQQLAANMPILKPVVSLTGTALQSTGKAVTKSGVDAFNARRAAFASSIYEPKLTPSVVKDRAGSTITKGINQTPVYTPSAYEQAAISDLQKLPIKASNTLQANYNVVGNAVNDEAKALQAALAKTPVNYKPAFLNTKLDTAFNSLKTDPLIVGDGEAVASRVFAKMKEISANNPNTPAGLLKSRQEFDAWARSKKGSVFDANDTAFSASVRSARSIANETISDIAPNAAVKDSLLRQSNLLGAMDNMETKLPSAAKTRFGMAMQKASSVVPKTVTGKLAEGAALAGLIATVPAATAVAGAAGLGGYGAYKAATSPALRKALGAALSGTGKVIKP